MRWAGDFIGNGDWPPSETLESLGKPLQDITRSYGAVIGQVCHASSLCFSLDGSKIIAGFPLYLRAWALDSFSPLMS